MQSTRFTLFSVAEVTLLWRYAMMPFRNISTNFKCLSDFACKHAEVISQTNVEHTVSTLAYTHLQINVSTMRTWWPVANHFWIETANSVLWRRVLCRRWNWVPVATTQSSFKYISLVCTSLHAVVGVSISRTARGFWVWFPAWRPSVWSLDVLPVRTCPEVWTWIVVCFSALWWSGNLSRV